ncbi:unnamed protein product [Ceratitis capitata]|uniref:(Mediterranean fruit fly) hypothetical protein n=1 Tax=Ceratitis capitata TaxID=7213 RepID=A0A811VKB1_CERCA|nr:unnamed protein product [Ceratitis capitata]
MAIVNTFAGVKTRSNGIYTATKVNNKESEWEPMKYHIKAAVKHSSSGMGPPDCDEACDKRKVANGMLLPQAKSQLCFPRPTPAREQRRVGCEKEMLQIW